MVKTIVHVMRHGEVHNPKGVLYGRLPGFRLSELGQRMAAAGANYLVDSGAKLDLVVASPLLRAQQTAAPSARAFGLPVLTDHRLIEAGSKLEGTRIHGDRTWLRDPRVWAWFRNPLRPSWGEPYAAQAHRMAGAVSGALGSAYGGQALLVSHQLPIWMLRSFVEGRPLAHNPKFRDCSLGSITSFTFTDHTLVGVDYVEPAPHLLEEAADISPGVSAAAVNRG